MRGFNYKKAIQALNLFATLSGGRLNKMKAIKLVWLSDRYYIRHRGRTITGDVYFALPYGPVASCTRDILENSTLSEQELSYKRSYIQSTGYTYISINEVNKKVFSESELETLLLMFKTYGHLNQWDISELSHKFPEWKRYEAALKSKVASRFEIDDNLFFQNTSDGFHMFEDNEETLKDMFEYHKELKSFNACL